MTVTAGVNVKDENCFAEAAAAPRNWADDSAACAADGAAIAGYCLVPVKVPSPSWPSEAPRLVGQPAHTLLIIARHYSCRKPPPMTATT
jgi:hypothetical protein